ncbi:MULTISPECIES: NHLP-related RiPP peptide [Novilysobacter]|uniref:NHLP-related RiPP peptide n=1 Tax=Novilysobacter TaxID=3382699 RepID=UPI002EDB304C
MATKKTTGSKAAAGKKSAPLDPEVADKLLDLLSTDNEFRRLFKKNPLAALIEAGYKPSESELDAAARKGPPLMPPGPPSDVPPIWSCCQVDRISPKATIAKTRELMKEHLTQGLSMTPIQWSIRSSSLRRKRS